MRILAIGATGYIGSHVVRLLTERDHEVTVLHRGETNASLPSGARCLLGNRDRLEQIEPEIECFAPEVVLDVIPYTERQARVLIETIRGLAGRVVVVSSADVYRNYDGFRGKATAPPDPVPLAEDAPLRETLYPYRGEGLSFEHAEDYEKLLVERVVLGQPELSATVLRLPAVYGPGDKQHRLWPYLRQMKDGRSKILMTNEQAEWRWTRGYVENVAEAVALAVTDDCAANRVYNVGETPAPTEKEWVERIGAAAGWNGEVISVSAEHLRQPFDWRYGLATDTSRIRRELGYAESISPWKGLERTVEWERAQSPEAGPIDYEATDAVLAEMEAGN